MINVHEHKTGEKATTKLLVSETDKQKVDTYLKDIRPYYDPNNISDKLLVLPEGKPFKNGDYISILSQMGKLGATATALGASPDTRALICKQMSHSMETEQRYYVGRFSDNHAAQAFRIMENLRSSSGNQ